MDWDKLKIFHTVAESGSFTKASTVLNLSQSAISRQIQSLENELKIHLFERHARGLVLTNNGEYLYKTAHEVISKLKDVEATLSDEKDKLHGKLTVTTVVSFGTTWLTPRIKEFMSLNPEIEIELIVETDTATTYNPLASVWKGNAVAPALRFAQRGVRFGIGSDTTSADGFKNLMAAEACQRIEHGLPVADFSCGAAWTWVNASTSQGAEATGAAGDHGALAIGQAADFIILDMMAPECLPSHDFEWELVRYYNRDQIDAVVINGRLCMSRGEPIGWDTEDLRRDAMAVSTKITSAPDIVRCHGPSHLYRPSRD